MALRLRNLFTNLSKVNLPKLYHRLLVTGGVVGGVTGGVIGVADTYVKPDQRSSYPEKTIEIMCSGTIGIVMGSAAGFVVSSAAPLWIPVYTGITICDAGIKIYDALYKIECIYS